MFECVLFLILHSNCLECVQNEINYGKIKNPIFSGGNPSYFKFSANFSDLHPISEKLFCTECTTLGSQQMFLLFLQSKCRKKLILS